MSTTSSSSDGPAPRHANWDLFLRQRRLMAELGRLQNDFKLCYCPPGCNGVLHANEGLPTGPGPQPAQPVRAPFVRVDSDLPRTWARPVAHRGDDSVVLAEARGTSDILLQRERDRATLRMSLQVRSDPSGAPTVGYFGEMFLTRWGHEEEFIGFIQSWHVDRRSNEDWEDLYLSDWALEAYRGTLTTETMDFLQLIFDTTFHGDEGGDKVPYQWHWPQRVADGKRTENAMLLPAPSYRDHFAAAWTRISDDTTDILYIPMIWIQNHFQGQRIISPAFELFFRLMTGGTLPAPYNITRPLSVLLESGQLVSPYAGHWTDSSGNEIDFDDRVNGIARGYARCGFMRLVDAEADPDSLDYHMGRSVDPAEYPAAAGDMAIVPPNPPSTDEHTPSPIRERRALEADQHRPERTSPESPSIRRGRNAAGGDDDQQP